MSSPHENTDTLQPPSEPFRRKSSEGGYDNKGYESPRRRISGQEHTEMGPVRKKSILVNSGETSGYSESGPVRKKSILHNSGDVIGNDTHYIFTYIFKMFLKPCIFLSILINYSLTNDKYHIILVIP